MNEDLKKLQAELDLIKWNDSQSNGGVDACGSYDFCAKCDKNAQYPCASAKNAADAATVKPVRKRSDKPASDKVVRARRTTQKAQ